MRYIQLELAVLVATFVALSGAQFQSSQFRIQPDSMGFIPSLQQDSSEDQIPSATVNYRQQSYEYEEDEDETQQVTPTPNRRQQQTYLRPNYNAQPNNNPKGNKKLIEEELEVEEPDRLSLLLEKSTFNCEGRTGYYADEGVNCEVFHYCQENQKHSWICPEGFSFHQVHLICMPPSGDNICDQSSKYHVVNDYLYKAINLEEHETRPNVSLKYSERYYPESFYTDERHDRDDDYSHERRQPIQVAIRKAPTTALPSYRQATLQANQGAYRSPDDINISLQQRRPQIIFNNPTTARYQQQQQQEEEEYNYEK